MGPSLLRVIKTRSGMTPEVEGSSSYLSNQRHLFVLSYITVPSMPEKQPMPKTPETTLLGMQNTDTAVKATDQTDSKTTFHGTF